MKKTILILFILFASVCGASAQIQQNNANYEQQSYSVYFEWNQWEITDNSQRAEFARALAELAKQLNANISIVGWADKIGSDLTNQLASLRRAKNVQDYLVKKGILAERITFSGKGVDAKVVDNAQARRVDVTLTFDVQQQPAEPAKPRDPKKEDPQDPKKEDPQELKKDEPKVQPEEEAPFVAGVPPAAIVEPLASPIHQFSLRTNLLYWVWGLPSIGAEWMARRNLGVLINGGWSPWSSKDWNKNWSGWFVSPEVRWYLGEQLRWFAGVQLLAGKYDLKPGYIGRRGTVISGGITGGYKLPLSKHFDMDFSLGLGYGSLKYDRYSKMGQNVVIGKSITKNSFMPTQAGVSLIWKIK